MGTFARPFKIGPPTRGLTDFPERATPEHSTQALNVEFSGGGVATRRGTDLISESFYSDSGAANRSTIVKLVKSFQQGSSNAETVVVGLIPTAGAEDNEERLLIRKQENFGGLASHQLNAPNFFSVDSASSRWDACMFNGNLVVCTDTNRSEHPQVHYSIRGDWDRVVSLSGADHGPVNRSMFPYHAGEAADSGHSDDPGTYDFMAGRAFRARYCRAHKGRLILAHFDMIKLPLGLHGNMAKSILWYSNVFDVQGWPIENIYLPVEGDQGAITGLAERSGSVVVFRESSISLYRINNPGPLGQTYRQVISDRGCIAHSTIIDDVNGMTCFLSNDGFYGFDGSRLHHLSAPISRTMQSIIENGSLGGAHAIHYVKKRQVWLAVPGKGVAPDHVLVMDYRFGHKGAPAWSVFEFQAASWDDGQFKVSLGGFCTNNGSSEIYGVIVGSDGIADYERFDVGDATDQQNGSTNGFRSRWESGPIRYGDGTVDRLRYIRPTVRPTMDRAITAWWRHDEQPPDEADDFNGQSVTFAPDDDSGGVALGAFVLNTDRLGGAEDHAKRLDVHSGGLGRTFRVGFQTDAAAGYKFDIRQLRLDVLKRRTRR
jgi:hypothetical protein